MTELVFKSQGLSHADPAWQSSSLSSGFFISEDLVDLRSVLMFKVSLGSFSPLFHSLVFLLVEPFFTLVNSTFS